MHFSLPENTVFQNFELSTVSSMRTGGRAAYALFPENKEMLKDAFFEAKESGLSVVLAGGTSNLLFPDDASRLCVIFTKRMTSPLTFDRTLVTAGCGVMLPYLSKEAAKRGLSGLEFACGIPGTIGGALFMNAGAYGGETGQIVKDVTVLSKKDGTFSRLSASDCAFSYRHTIFSENRDLCAVEATFSLREGNEEEITARCRELLASRREKQPLEYPSCGSTFKRPEGHFAGKLIEDCGLKGFSIGGASVSEKHAGFLINRGGATSGDVLSLIRAVREHVFEKTGVMLEPEVEIIKG